jgi:NAD(P)-dependent dehydrogenase (short-subunit alcohol dehydrogenase family)
MTLKFDGRVVLITGASGGLGRTVTDAFWDAGALVVTVERNPEPESRERLIRVAADLTDPAGVEKAASAAQRIDVLVHLMGGFAGGTLIHETQPEVLDRMLRMNLIPAYDLFRAVLPKMQAHGYGRILAIGSQSAAGGAPGLSAYAASKAALASLIQTVAAEYKASGITANAVLPSVIDTPANRAAMPQADRSAWVTPAALAGLLLYLASDAAPDINGALIPIGR